MGAGHARDAAGSRGGWMGQGRLTILQGISASQRVRISHVQGEGGAPADRAPQSRWSRDGCQRGPDAGSYSLGGAPQIIVVRWVLARARTWQGAHLGACLGSGVGCRAPHGAGRRQVYGTG